MEANSDSLDRKWNVSLIQTKMMPPRLPPGCVQRPALFERLRERGEGSITIVTAPAGFGKTTLLAGWKAALLDQAHPVAWLTLDEEDDDPQQFGAYLVAAFSRASEEIAGPAQRLLNNDALTPIKTVISVLLNSIAACGQYVFLVLDDVDRLTAKPVLTVLSRLLRYAPENMHILLGARGEPALALGHLKAPEKLMRLDADDLRFSIDDAQAFFDQTGAVPLGRTSVELLNEATEGWVAGLQLASLSLSEEGDAAKVASGLAGTSSGIDRYLNDTVFAHLPPAVLKFLLCTSILQRLNHAVCDAIMGGKSEGQLDWLEQHNVFIRPLDEGREWYRYHALLSEVLRRRLNRQMPNDVPSLHRRACQWFADAGLWPEAVRHALAAGEHEQAAQWVENCVKEMFERGNPHTLLGWIGKLPPDLVMRRLRLRLLKARALTFSPQMPSAIREIRGITEEMNRVRRDNRDAVDEVTQAELDALYALIAGASDDSERAFEFGQAAATSMAPADPWVKSYAQMGQFFGLMYKGAFPEIRRIWAVEKDRAWRDPASIYSDMLRHGMYGHAALVHGELPEARHTFEVAHHHAEAALGRSSPGTAGLASCLASIYYECNELPAARKLIAGSTPLVLETSPLGALIRHVLCASRLLWRDGETGSALAVLEDGRQVALGRQWLRLKLACDAETVRLLLHDANVAEARQLADELSASVPAQCEGKPGSAVETWTSYCLLQARVLLAENLADKATLLLTRSLDTVTALGWRYQETLISVLLALAFERCGASDKATVSLKRALRTGQAISMLNSFVDEGQPVHALLRRLRNDSATLAPSEAAYLDRLLDAFDATNVESLASPVTVETVPPPSDILSARELDVLNHVARGLSNKEIGRALKLAPETVKWHLKNIFEKLDVSSRIEAVQSMFWTSR
jgi:LuxR family maltose regulon positive regulatory protein